MHRGERWLFKLFFSLELSSEMCWQVLSIDCVFQVIHKAGKEGGPHPLTRSTHTLEEDAASLWDQDKLPAFAIFKADQKNFYPDPFPDRCTQQAASNISVNPRLSQDAQNKRKRQHFLFPYGPTTSGLCRKSSSFLLLPLTRARTEVVYIAHSRGRGRGRTKVNKSPKSKVSWWKKGFRHRRLLRSNKRLSCFDSDFPSQLHLYLEWLRIAAPHVVGTSLNSHICPKKL